MINDKTHICYIELDGNVITRSIDGSLNNVFTGNLTIIHKILEYLDLDAKTKARIKIADPQLYLGAVQFFIRNPKTGKQIMASTEYIRKFSKFINKSSEVVFENVSMNLGAK